MESPVHCWIASLLDLLYLCDGSDNHNDDHDVEDGIGELGIPGERYLYHHGHGFGCNDGEGSYKER